MNELRFGHDCSLVDDEPYYFGLIHGKLSNRTHPGIRSVSDEVVSAMLCKIIIRGPLLRIQSPDLRSADLVQDFLEMILCPN